MMENKAEILMGAAVLAVAAVFLIYAGQITGFAGGQSEYRLNASFRNIDGIEVGTEVRIAGVKVGRVAEVNLDRETFFAKAEFTVHEHIEVPDDSAVTVSSEGLLGGAYLEIVPGASPFFLEPGDEIDFTQGSVNLIGLLMKLVSGGNVESRTE
ncbi:MAG: outer membrane lipid asymmetry maintenance protein MlaD [Roseovarius sp.]|nr:outer membrane lipid asymmetry maintenance protein MlaD [Roseovarius sp.]